MKRSPWRLGFLLLAECASMVACVLAAAADDWPRATFFEIAAVFSWLLTNDELTPEEKAQR